MGIESCKIPCIIPDNQGITYMDSGLPILGSRTIFLFRQTALW